MANTFKDKTFQTLWLLSVLGSFCVLPYVAATDSNVAITPRLLLVVGVQSSILYAIAIFFGLKASRKIGFLIYPTQSYFPLSVASGALVGLSIVFMDGHLFSSRANVLNQELPDVAVWKALLASVYGAVNEEVALRLLLVSIVALVLKMISFANANIRAWSSIIICSFFFGLGHLPMLYSIGENPNSWDFVRVFILNGFAGTLFGWLYWRRGLASSMLSHFVADLVIHVI